ncbi:MAG: Membrane alanine aminopeptidase, partial [Myxococcales bacterium]|nr:Membrane alanine aminopeptidase [Myxococcales bacterium]
MRTYVLALAVLGFACPAPTTPTNTTPTHVVVTPAVDAAPVVTPSGFEPPQPALRLPKNFVPKSYEARLHVDPSKPTFDGAISIAGEVSERSSVIWLHGRGLTVQRAAATRGNPFESPGGTSSALTVTPRGQDLLELRADPPLDAGAWTLSLEYTGHIDDVNTTGAFKETVAGATYVYSQFEAVYARRVFPCVDEPDAKVPWKLTLEVPPGVIAVSNTPVAEETPLADGGKRFAFERTKPLPSYLIAFGVGPFDVIDAGKTKTGVPIRVITLKGRGADAAWAAKSTPRVLELLEEWFGIPYPYGK